MDTLALLAQAKMIGLVISVDTENRLQIAGKPTPEAETVVNEIALRKSEVIATLTATIDATTEAQQAPAIIHTGLTWNEAERIRDELQIQCGYSSPMYGVGKHGDRYCVKCWDYRRNRSAI